MERTQEILEARVRNTPLEERLKDCQKRIGNMCAELRGPKMSIPVEHYDDDFYINTTLADAQATIEALQARVQELEEITKVICGHCCEPMEIPSKAVLQSQLTQRTAEMEAAKKNFDRRTDECNEISKMYVDTHAELERVRGEMPSETVLSVTEWANTTFGQATIRTQIARAEKEFVELLKLQEVDHDNAQLAEEAADVCICLYRVIGTLDPEAINKKMAKNRARKWKVDGQGTAQHVGE